MKRGLVFSLCALAALAASQAMAQSTVDLSLNLRYTDPADPSEGGRWFLMAKTNSTVGIAGISAYISGIDTTGIALGNPTAVGTGSATYPVVSNTATGSIANGGNPYNGVFEDGAIDPVNVVWGFDLSATGAITPGVGTATGPGRINNDTLKNAAWNNAAVIASGTFSSATRPAFVDDVGPNNNDTAANVLQNTTLGTPAVAATVAKSVRGDSIRSLGLNTPATAGLLRGDTDRDFDVDGDDLNNVLFNFNTTGKTWNQGDVTDGLAGHTEGQVNGDDLNQVLFNFNQNSLTPPPAVASIPEPASFGLLALAAAGILAIRRR